MNLSQYDAFCRWQFAASCRLLPPAVMHTAVAPEGTGSKSVRHLPLTGKNLLLWWRYWLVGAASEPLWLRVAGERRWPAY